MDVKTQVLNAIHKMGKLQSVVQDTHGNVSMRDGDRIWIKPSGVPYDQVGRDDVCCVNIDDGIPYANIKKPSVDAPHHVAIYRNNSSVRAVCHIHSPYVVAYAVVGRGITCYTTEHADYFGDDVRCLPYSDLNSWGDDVLLDDRPVIEKAVLLERHGALTFGRDASHAVSLAAALENIARKNYLAERIGTCVPFERVEVAKWHRRYMDDYGQ